MGNQTINPKTAIILGASGLVGRHCLKALLQETSYTEIIALVRKPLKVNHPKLKTYNIDFDTPELYKELIKGDDVYCCLGTTFLKSPKKEDYFRIDFTYPFEIAKIAKENGAERFALVSALNANPKSFLFYSRVKGKLEKSLESLNYKGLYIFRPSYLIGKREEFRLIEKIGSTILKIFFPFLIGPLKKFRAIKASTVAKTMVKIMQQQKVGTYIFLSDEI